jgi:hypothetical protein
VASRPQDKLTTISIVLLLSGLYAFTVHWTVALALIGTSFWIFTVYQSIDERLTTLDRSNARANAQDLFVRRELSADAAWQFSDQLEELRHRYENNQLADDDYEAQLADLLNAHASLHFQRI